MTYCIHNGEIIPEESLRLARNNRAFLYGDGFFETIRLYKGVLVNVDLHLDRLERGMKLLSIIGNPYLEMDRLESKMNAWVDKTGVEHAKVRLVVYRDSGGSYAPEADDSSYVLFVEEIGQELYPFNEEGIHLGLSEAYQKPLHPISNFKSLNAQGLVMSAVEKRNASFGDLVLLNEEGRLCEGISSNVFLIMGEQIITPNLNEGCLAGTTRRFIIHVLKEAGRDIVERPIEPSELREADEVFLSSAINGVQWVASYKDRRYYNTTSKEISDLLRESVVRRIFGEAGE